MESWKIGMMEGWNSEILELWVKQLMFWIKVIG